LKELLSAGCNALATRYTTQH